MKRGIKHLIECHCILSQYKNKKDPVYHRFTAFSEIDDSDTVVPKLVNCNNCGISHKIIDLCKSIINTSREDSNSVRTIEDIRLSMPEDLVSVMDSYECDLATWEHAEFILRNGIWGNFIVLSRENINEGSEGKILRFESSGKYRIEPFIQRNVVE